MEHCVHTHTQTGIPNNCHLDIINPCSRRPQSWIRFYWIFWRIAFNVDNLSQRWCYSILARRQYMIIILFMFSSDYTPPLTVWLQILNEVKICCEKRCVFFYLWLRFRIVNDSLIPKKDKKSNFFDTLKRLF